VLADVLGRLGALLAVLATEEQTSGARHHNEPGLLVRLH